MLTMVALVGEQPQPNFLPVLHYGLDRVIFVYSDRTQQKYTHLAEEIQRMSVKTKTIGVHGIKTDAYNIATIVTAINDELATLTTLSPQSLIFNLTGGTKPMSLAAYQVAAQYNAPVIYLQSERGQSIIDLYTWQDHQLSHQKSEPLSDTYMSLHDILNLHLGRKTATGKAAWEEKGPNPDAGGGHLFELAIADVLKKNGYETMCGVKNANNNVDIDVMIRYQNQVGIIEAKLGDKGLYGVKQLSAAMRYIGATYIKQFLVIGVEASQDQKTICELLNITIISLLHYQKGMSFLPREDVETLLNAIDKIMMVRRV